MPIVQQSKVPLVIDISAGQDFVEVVLTSPTTCLTSVAVILSGGRYEHDQSETVLTF